MDDDDYARAVRASARRRIELLDPRGRKTVEEMILEDVKAVECRCHACQFARTRK